MCPGAPRGGVRPWPSRIFTLDGSYATEAEEICVPLARTLLELASSCPSAPSPRAHCVSGPVQCQPHTQEHPEPRSSCKTRGEQMPRLLSEQNFRSYPVSERGKDDPRTRGLCNAEGEQRAVFTLSFPGGSSPSAVGMVCAPACRALGLPQTREQYEAVRQWKARG